jgi:hypothetical protein
MKSKEQQMSIELLDTSSPTWVSQWDVDSHTSSEVYKVSQKYDGTWACSCARWKFCRAPKLDCKHIEEVKMRERVTVPARELVAMHRDPKTIERRMKNIPAGVEPPVVFVKQTLRKITLRR